MNMLKQSTAATILLGPFVDDADGVTAETGLTIAQADVRLSKNGGDMVAKNNATSCTHDELGYYGCPLDTTDTGTLGRLQVMVSATGALPVWAEYLIVPAAVYDSLVLGTDYLQADTMQIEGADATSAINAECDTALADYDAPTKAEMDAGFAALNDPVTALSTYDPPTKAEMDAALAALNDPVTALSDYDPPTKAEMDAALATLNDPTAAAVADAVWDEALSSHDGTAGSVAEALRIVLQALAGKLVTDSSDNTMKIYDTSGAVLLVTLTMAEAGTQITRTAT